MSANDSEPSARFTLDLARRGLTPGAASTLSRLGATTVIPLASFKASDLRSPERQKILLKRWNEVVGG